MRLTFILLAVLLIFVVTFMEVTVAFITKIVVRTAPKDIQERILVRPDNPKWKTAIGIISDVMILLCILGIFIISGVDAVKNNMTFGMIFLRYIILFEGYKLFDIICFDWLLH